MRPLSLRIVPPAVRTLLDTSGRPWRLKQLRSHIGVEIDGHLIAVLSRGTASSNWRRDKNLLADVRRHLLTTTQEIGEER